MNLFFLWLLAPSEPAAATQELYALSDVQPDEFNDGNSRLQLAVQQKPNVEVCERDVMKEVEVFESRFDALKNSTLEYLNQRSEYSLKFFPRIRTRVASISGSLRIRHKRFYDRNAEKMLKTKNFDELFVLLCSYWHFNNTSLLEYIITHFGNEELKKKTKQYKEDLHTFQSRTKAVDLRFQGPYLLPSGHSEVVATLDVNEVSYTLAEAERLKKEMCMVSMFNESVMQYSGSTPGSLIITWCIPSSFAPLLAHCMSDSFFQEHHITAMSVDGVQLESYKEQHSLLDVSVVSLSASIVAVLYYLFLFCHNPGYERAFHE